MSNVRPKAGKGAQGLGGAKRHRKVLRGNIGRITKPAIKRILSRAGVKRVSGLVYEEMRGNLRVFLEKIVRDMITYMEHDRRRTVQQKDLDLALETNGIALAAGINENASKTASLQSCNARGKKSTREHKPKEITEEGPKKAHRFHPGTVALRDIRKQQKNSDCLAIPKKNFQDLTREVAQDYITDVRFSADVFDLLQLTVEDYLIKLAKSANLLALHAQRETLMPKDIQAVKIINEEFGRF